MSTSRVSHQAELREDCKRAGIRAVIKPRRTGPAREWKAPAAADRNQQLDPLGLLRPLMPRPQRLPLRRWPRREHYP